MVPLHGATGKDWQNFFLLYITFAAQSSCEGVAIHLLYSTLQLLGGQRRADCCLHAYSPFRANSAWPGCNSFSS